MADRGEDYITRFHEGDVVGLLDAACGLQIFNRVRSKYRKLGSLFSTR